MDNIRVKVKRLKLIVNDNCLDVYKDDSRDSRVL